MQMDLYLASRRDAGLQYPLQKQQQQKKMLFIPLTSHGLLPSHEIC